MLPSGPTVGEEEESSRTRPAGIVFCAGSTPGFVPRRHPPGEPLAGSRAPGKLPWSLLQASSSRSRNEVHHFGVRSELTAARQGPHGARGGTGFAHGGNGSCFTSNSPRHWSFGSGAAWLPAAVAAVSTE